MSSDIQENNIPKFHLARFEEFPNIDLYLDQVFTFLEKNLADFVPSGEDKLITKTMINNYVKQGVLPPPIKKKYNNEHIAYLFVICILKQVYSISDISQLINLAIKTTSPKEAYNSFCAELENAIFLTYSNSDNLTVNSSFSASSQVDLSKEHYLLKNVVQSYANKLYVEKNFLHK